MLIPDYSEWETRKITVDILRLDKENPRLPVDVRKLRQDKIREFLVLNEQVDKIAKLISSEGFIPFEPIYVIKEGEFFTVLEGNRRTCALQLLRDPSKAPASKQRLFKKLAKTINTTDIEKISVVIAPSRSVLRKILYLKHADEAQKKWHRQQKHRFIADSIFDGKTINEIADDLKETLSSVSEAVLEVLLQETFLELDLPPDIEEKSIQSNFPLSTVTRIIGSSEFRKYTGLRVDGASLVADMDTENFKLILRKIVIDLVEKKVTSRTLEKSIDINEYIEELKKLKITTEDYGSNDPFAFTPSTRPLKKSDEKSRSRPPRKQEKLIGNTKTYSTGIPKLDDLIQQGQIIPAGSYMLASALLLRTILELTVVRIFEVNNERHIAINDRGRTNRLSTIMKELVKRKSWFTDEAYRMDLERFCDENNFQYKHIETLNRYTHGQYSMPDKETLNAIWLMIEPLIVMCCDKSDSVK